MDSFVDKIIAAGDAGDYDKSKQILGQVISDLSRKLEAIRHSYHPLDTPLIVAALRVYTNALESNSGKGCKEAVQELMRELACVSVVEYEGGIS